MQFPTLQTSMHGHCFLHLYAAKTKKTAKQCGSIQAICIESILYKCVSLVSRKLAFVFGDYFGYEGMECSNLFQDLCHVIALLGIFFLCQHVNLLLKLYTWKHLKDLCMYNQITIKTSIIPFLFLDYH